MDDFLRQYLITALWSSSDCEGTPFDQNHDIDDIAPESLEKAQADCQKFKSEAGDLLEGLSESTAGHDFWLTRNGHGAGFWDGDYEEKTGEALTVLSKKFSEVSVVKGDDGKLYIE